MAPSRKELIEKLIENARDCRLCGPSDDPDEQTAVTSGLHHIVTQFQRLASPILPAEVTNGQIVLVFVKYLEVHPERLHKPANLLLVEALRKAFPCKA
jgi:hypothetical protein